MKIEVKNLVRSFGKKRAVDDISFEFESGNIIGFIGPNGAGKTTTIKIMSTLELPDSGDVLYDNVSVITDPEIVRNYVGYMPDSLPDFKDIRVWEYLDFFARCFKLQGDQRRKILLEIEEFTQLGDIRYKNLAALSKGMKQRVSLARALIHNPKVLVMDEPAAGLDPRARLELRSLLKVLAGQGKAILLSSHILSELQDICDGAVIIEKGRLLAAGSLHNLLASAKGVQTKDLQNEDLSGMAKVAEAGSTLIIKTLNAAESVREKLLEQPLVSNVKIIDNNEVRADFNGKDAELTPIIQSLLAAQVPIVGFSRQELGLEEMFMKITTGGVQ